MDETANTTATKSMSNESWAELWKVSAMVGTGILAVIGALAWYFGNQASKDTQAAFDKYKMDTALTIESVKQSSAVEISKANAIAEEAKKDAAKANADSARLNLELERIKEENRPRTITQEQADAFLKVIGDFPRNEIQILTCNGTRDGYTFASAIKRLLQSANYPVVGEIRSFLNTGRPLDADLLLKFRDNRPENIGYLLIALKSMGFRVDGPVQDQSLDIGASATGIFIYPKPNRNE